MAAFTQLVFLSPPSSSPSLLPSNPLSSSQLRPEEDQKGYNDLMKGDLDSVQHWVSTDPERPMIVSIQKKIGENELVPSVCCSSFHFISVLPFSPLLFLIFLVRLFDTQSVQRFQ